MALDEKLQTKLIAHTINTFFSLQKQYINKSLFNKVPETENQAILEVSNILSKELGEVVKRIVGKGEIIEYYIRFSKNDFIPNPSNKSNGREIIRKLKNLLGEPDGFLEKYVKFNRKDLRSFVIIEYKKGDKGGKRGNAQLVKYILGRIFYEVYTGKIRGNRIYVGLLISNGKEKGRISTIIISWYKSGRVHFLLSKKDSSRNKSKIKTITYNYFIISYNSLKNIMLNGIKNAIKIRKLKNRTPSLLGILKEELEVIFYPNCKRKPENLKNFPEYILFGYIYYREINKRNTNIKKITFKNGKIRVNEYNVPIISNFC